MNFRQNSIRSILFLTYSMIIVIVLTISFIAFYSWSSYWLKNKAKDSIASTSATVNEKLNAEIQKMDTVSLNILYSNLVKERFLQFTQDSKELGKPSYNAGDAITNSKDLAEILVAANGPAFPAQQIYLYDFDGNMFGSGYDNRKSVIRLADKPWYQEVLKNEKGKVITIPEKDEELAQFLSSQDDASSISLLRVFFDKYNTPEGIAEVKQSVSNAFKSVSNQIAQTDGSEKLIVYDDQGNLIYPIHANSQNLNEYIRHFLSHSDISDGYIMNPQTKNRELYTLNHSDYTGWNTAVIISEKKLLAPLTAFTRAFLLLSLIILTLAIFLSYLAARRITKPIASMHAAIKSTNLETISSNSQLQLNSGFNELDRLKLAFIKMSERLKLSMDQVLLSQSQELQARMLALQSQMNPHFLYNTLTTISVMAEEHMNEQIVGMIENLSDMLRYISSDDSNLVAMDTELSYTEKYLQCIKYRYGGSLHYEFEIDDKLRDIHVPKLIIQPLVENALKYSTKLSPPWHIHIQGYADSSRWIVSVRDKGPGFSSEVLEEVNAKVSHIEQTGLVPNLQLDGMGLMNIYIRLKMSYGPQMVFEIANLPEGGAQVTIGGNL